MHVSVKDILAQEVGASTIFTIDGEQPTLSDLELAEPIAGQVRVVRSEEGLLAGGEIATKLRLTCDRCLREFTYPVNVSVSGEFVDQPGPESWPIDRSRFQIDLAPMVRQELLLALPIKRLCEPECLGLCDVCGRRQESPHKHHQSVISNQPRIIKGKNHGSTKETN